MLYSKRVVSIFSLLALVPFIIQCESTGVRAEFDEVKTKKLFLEGKNGKTYEIYIDEHGKVQSVPLD